MNSSQNKLYNKASKTCQNQQFTLKSKICCNKIFNFPFHKFGKLKSQTLEDDQLSHVQTQSTLTHLTNPKPTSFAMCNFQPHPWDHAIQPTLLQITHIQPSIFVCGSCMYYVYTNIKARNYFENKKYQFVDLLLMI